MEFSSLVAEPISVIVACRNGENRLPALFESLSAQGYDRSKLELILVDDDSTDRTREIAVAYGARVLRNGGLNCELGKSIGIGAASHDLLFFIDDDNRLPHRGWLAAAVRALRENPDAAGVQPSKFTLVPGDPPVNRYCSLFGSPDPLVYYLGRQDRLRHSAERWELPGRVVRETESYWVVQFDETNTLTLGSIGFLTRRSLLQKTPWSPYFFHIDSCHELIRLGHDRFVMLKDDIIHEHCKSSADLLAKLHRNMSRFLAQADKRTFRYRTSPAKVALSIVRMATLADPVFQSLREYVRTKDAACFFLPYIAMRATALYSYLVVRHALGMNEAC